jgi:hypothetical protein
MVAYLCRRGLKLRLRLMLLVCAALALTVGVAIATAGSGNSANAKLCQKDGWKSQYRSEDGSSFTNESACVSYAANGGTLTTAVADVSLSEECHFGGGLAGIHFFATNAGPSAVTVTVHSEGIITIDEDGNQLAGGEEQTVTLQPGVRIEFRGVSVFSPLLPVHAYAQVTAANAHDPDSTPNNYSGGFTGPVLEDDEALANLPVGTSDC